MQCDVVGKKHFACLPYLVGGRGAAAKHCRGGSARQSDPRDVGFNLSASPWHPVKTVFLFLLSTSYPCPMQCTLTHFSCCTGHTTYSPEGGVHNTCRGSSESTIHLYLLEGPAVSLLPMPLFTSNQALPFGGSEPCHLFPSLDFSSIGT